MDKVNVLSRVRVHSKFLNQLSTLTNGNLSKAIQALAESYGVVSQKQVNGVLDNSFRVEQNTPTSLLINEGYAISNIASAMRILISLSKESIDVTSLLDDTMYNLYLIGKETSYEQGTLTLTNGSKIVTVANGDFNKLDPYESLVIDTSGSGNDGVYEIYNVVGGNTLELVEEFTGTTEAALKWKVAGNFKGYKAATETDLIYAYDGYDLVISSQNLSTGFILATFEKKAGVLASIADKRSTNLFSVKAVGKTLADSVINGVVNAITTIEEKASAGSIDKIVTDNISEGFKSGFGMTLATTVLTITGGVAYNSVGKRIEVPQATILDLKALVTAGDITEGSNSLYLSYVSPNSYQLLWNPPAKLSSILVGKVLYSSAAEPTPFSLDVEVKTPIKHKVNSIVFEEKPINSYLDKEIYYRNGILYYQYLDLTIRDPILKEVELINYVRLNTILNQALNTVAKSEKIRFSLYPTAEKDSWFFSNGVQSPVLMGYKHKIVSWKVGTLNMQTPGGSSQVYDYTTKEVLVTSKITNIITKALDAATGLGETDSTLGIYFSGSGSQNKIKLVHNGNVISETDMQGSTDDIGQAVINKLYQVEIVVESTSAIIISGIPVEE